MSNTRSCSIRISQSSQITLLQLGHKPDVYLSSPHISHCIWELETVIYFLLLVFSHRYSYVDTFLFILLDSTEDYLVSLFSLV